MNGTIGNIYVNRFTSTARGVVRWVAAARHIVLNYIEWGWSMGPYVEVPSDVPRTFEELHVDGYVEQEYNGGPQSRHILLV